MHLDLNLDTIRNIILRAREFHAQEGVSFPESPSEDNYDYLQVLADYGDDLTYQEVTTEINKLEPDQQITLVALLYVGRGDFEVSEWEHALTMAKDNWNDKAGQYLLGHPLIANYLEEGLAKLGYPSLNI